MTRKAGLLPNGSANAGSIANGVAPPQTPVAAKPAAAIEHIEISRLTPYTGNARRHSQRQIRLIAKSIQRFGFVNPVLIDASGTILAGHGRVDAARYLGMSTVPALRIEHLDEAGRRAYVLADNRLAELAGWDRQLLSVELQGLIDIGYEVELTGFAMADIDLLLEDAEAASADPLGPEDHVPAQAAGPAVTQPGDLWRLGDHRLLCGDARSASAYGRLLGRKHADLVFTDPPYNVPIGGHVCGLGRIRHREFAMAAGEMSAGSFAAFLKTVLGNAASVSRDGAIHFVCMDWRHIPELHHASREIYSALLNLCVWNKDNGGMGSLYRSKHELVLVFKVGTASHINNVELGRHGRNRTNVWNYAGVNTFRDGRLDELALHPTVKPVALVADAIKDVSRRRDTVLDPFAGSGTTIIAADKTGRRACCIEIDPNYVDVAVRRWQQFTGRSAVLAGSRSTFEQRQEILTASARETANG